MGGAGACRRLWVQVRGSAGGGEKHQHRSCKGSPSPVAGGRVPASQGHGRLQPGGGVGGSYERVTPGLGGSSHRRGGA